MSKEKQSQTETVEATHISLDDFTPIDEDHPSGVVYPTEVFPIPSPAEVRHAQQCAKSDTGDTGTSKRTVLYREIFPLWLDDLKLIADKTRLVAECMSIAQGPDGFASLDAATTVLGEAADLLEQMQETFADFSKGEGTQAVGALDIKGLALEVVRYE